MFLIASTSVIIDRPRESVFPYAADLAHFAGWFPGVIAVKPRDQAPITTVGKLYDEQLAMPFGRRRSVTIRVLEAEPQQRLVTEGSLPVLLPRMEMVFADAGAGACRLEWRMFSRNTAPLARWTILPLARRTMQKRAEVAMGRLKNRLEPSP
jgi:uncharacterized protein YndB with AHSA1/START domain